MSEWNMASRAAADRLESFILETQWEDLPAQIQERAMVCAVDLMAVMIACSHTRIARKGVQLAEEVFAVGSVPVMGTSTRLNLMGAVTAYGYNINGLDADDGHNLIKGHPGAVLLAGLLPAALKARASYREFLTALAVGYEVAVRAGLSLHQYYGYYHGTGSWGAFGVAAGVSKLLGVDRRTLSNALGIADYQGPLAPVMRIVEIPSMNKDGVAWGAVTGAMAVEAARRGVTGQFYNLLEPGNREQVDSLGQDYEIMNLYFKFFPCCRWAHPAIVAALSLRGDHPLRAEEVKRISIRTFEAATKLSSVQPASSEEAQYNMVYPVCAALVEGHFTPVEVSEEYLARHPDVIALMDRVEFQIDAELEAAFPRKRYARLEIVKESGETLVSDLAQPLGEQEDNVDVDWVTRKFHNLTAHCFPRQAAERLIDQLSRTDAELDLCGVIEWINRHIQYL